MNFILALLSILTFAAMDFDLNIFVFWNILPVIVAAGIFNNRVKKPFTTDSCFHTVLAILITHCFFHVVMYFDIGKSATGSSTSALAFIFIPFVALAVGAAVFVLSKLFTVLLFK